MAPHAVLDARSLAARGLDQEGQRNMKWVIPAVIGGLVGVVILVGLIVWVLTAIRSRRREAKFWKKAEARNSLRQSRAMVLAERESLATRNSVATLSSLGSGVSGPQVTPDNSGGLVPHLPTHGSDRSLRASIISSQYTTPYDSSPLARNSSLPSNDPWDASSEVDPEEKPMLYEKERRSSRPSLSIRTGSDEPPAYGKTYVAAHEYPAIPGRTSSNTAAHANTIRAVNETPASKAQ